MKQTDSNSEREVLQTTVREMRSQQEHTRITDLTFMALEGQLQTTQHDTVSMIRRLENETREAEKISQSILERCVNT